MALNKEPQSTLNQRNSNPNVSDNETVKMEEKNTDDIEQSSGSDIAAERASSSPRGDWKSALFGGPNTYIGPRTAPVLPHLRATITTESGSDTNGSEVAKQLLAKEKGNDIQYRTCTWQHTTALLLAEYICLAILSFPWAYSILGLGLGIVMTIAVAAIVLYTSLTVWEYCLRHPEVRDVCDIGQMLFWGSPIAWWCTLVMFLLNNVFIMALHVLTIAKYFNTVTDHSQCTVTFAVIGAIISFACSLPRTLNLLSKLGSLSAIFTFISVVLVAIFAAIEKHPALYNADPISIIASTGLPGGDPTVTAGPTSAVTFITGMSAFLNISYTFIGQITLPTFISEMKDPRDFPKALWSATIAEIILFSIVGAIDYAFTGNQYIQAPAFGSLSDRIHLLVSFSFMVPTLVFLGVLYAVVSGKFIFNIRFTGSRHLTSNTVKGWIFWTAILAGLWAMAFIIAEVIPFFSDLLSLMSSLFDSFFGFIFWGVAWFLMRRADHGKDWLQKTSKIGMAFNAFLILMGLFFLTAGTYVSVQSIINSYASGAVGGVFTCENNGI